MAVTQAAKAQQFCALHEAPDAFVVANVWDGGSARMMAALGFAALATSSGASAGAGRVLHRGRDRRSGRTDLRTPPGDGADRGRGSGGTALPFPFTLTVRTENFLRGRPDLDDTIERLNAYEAAGADALMAPGLPDSDSVRAVCAAVGKPFNFMVGIKGKSFTVAALSSAGVKRISLATSLYRAAMTGAAEHGEGSSGTRYLRLYRHLACHT
jgi:2-methylisocitrate lyase-like PEP mutase family enzyme